MWPSAILAIPSCSTRSDPHTRFIIDRVWLHSWLCFVNENGPVPSAISNHTLLEPDGAPRSGLEKGRHYRGVNAAVWDFFQNIYGGGPAIPRISLDIYAPHEDAP
mmetsp:Transcript_3472/g.8768  ORF Transcript_3472/g.8768 Transcript_3472/m.8768 type:complete len:105 (-) Transcript_3472:217-531(-)